MAGAGTRVGWLGFGDFPLALVVRGGSHEIARMLGIDAKKMVLTTSVLLNNSESRSVCPRVDPRGFFRKCSKTGDVIH